jgi:prepilin-type N-terminal cleavage/methylation domain-containing protein
MTSRSALPNRPRSGFTLIELLVVIAIIALLVSILLPSLATARKLVESVTCATTMRQIHIGSAMYATQWNGATPNAMKSYNDSDSSMSWGEKAQQYYANSLAKEKLLSFVKPGESNLRSMSCPVYLKTKGFYDWLIKSDGTTHEQWPQWISFNYGMVWTSGRPGESAAEDYEYAVYNMAAVPHPSEFMFLAETHRLGPHEQRALHLTDGWRQEFGGKCAFFNSWYYYDDPVGPEPHLDKLNIILYDGHHESLSYDEIKEKQYYVLTD